MWLDCYKDVQLARTPPVAYPYLRAQARLLQVEGVLLARPAAELLRLARARRRRRLRLARRPLRLALQAALLHLHTNKRGFYY